MTVERAARVAVIALLLAVVGAATASADDAKRLYVTVDKTQAISVQSSPITQISVTNPAIADVFVTSPTQVLLSGKAPGRTSLIVVQAGQIGYYDVIVHPSPAIVPTATLVPADEHGVEVLRAGRPSHQLFVKDADRVWVPLGTMKVEPEPAAK